MTDLHLTELIRASGLIHSGQNDCTTVHARCDQHQLLLTCRRAGETLWKPLSMFHTSSSEIAHSGSILEPSSLLEVAADYAESGKPTDAPPQARLSTAASVMASYICLKSTCLHGSVFCTIQVPWQTWLSCNIASTRSQHLCFVLLTGSTDLCRLRECKRGAAGAVKAICSSLLPCPPKKSWWKASKQCKQLLLQQSMKRRSDTLLSRQCSRHALPQVCRHLRGSVWRLTMSSV